MLSGGYRGQPQLGSPGCKLRLWRLGCLQLGKDNGNRHSAAPCSGLPSSLLSLEVLTMEAGPWHARQAFCTELHPWPFRALSRHVVNVGPFYDTRSQGGNDLSCPHKPGTSLVTAMEALRVLTFCGSWTMSYLAEAGAPKPTQAPPLPSGTE